MPGFYLITSAMALIGVLVVIRPLLRRNERGAKTAFTSTQSDIAVLRAQIKELDQQHQNAPETAQSTRIELARRLLAATSRAETAQELRPAPPRATAMMGGLAMIGVPVLALGLYLGLGQPGMPDHPMTMSPRDVAKAIPQTPAAPPPPSQAEAEARARADAPAAAAPPEDKEYVALIDQLEKVIAERPTDIKGLRLLAKGQVRLGRYGAAWHSYAALIAELEKKDPGSVPALLYAQQAEAMALAAGGYISPQADALIAQALTRDPDLDVARYYRGLSLMQKGDGEQAIAIWQRLREDTPADTPLHEQLTQMLAQAQRNAAPTDPSRMTPLQRQEMIEGMVARLETRLREQGGSAEEWVKLMNAYVQLERPDEAARVYAMGLDALTDDTGAGFLREQALLLGVKAP